MTEQQQTIKYKQRVAFSQIDNALICSNEISGLAFKLWCYLFSRPENWTFFWSDILPKMKEGRNAVKNAGKELEELGYMSKEQKKVYTGRGKEWRWGGMDISLFYDPMTNPIFAATLEQKERSPLTENGSSGNESSGNESSGYEIAGNGSTNKELSKQDLSKKYLSNSLSFPLANAKRENFSKPSLLEVKQIFIDKNLKSDSEKYFLFREKTNWSGVKNLEADISWWENGHKEKFPALHIEKKEVFIEKKEEEPDEIKDLRSSIKSHICWQFPNSSNKGSVIYSKLFLDARIEQNGNDYTIFAKDQQALKYGEVLAKINVIVEIEPNVPLIGKNY